MHGYWNWKIDWCPLPPVSLCRRFFFSGDKKIVSTTSAFIPTFLCCCLGPEVVFLMSLFLISISPKPSRQTIKRWAYDGAGDHKDEKYYFKMKIPTQVGSVEGGAGQLYIISACRSYRNREPGSEEVRKRPMEQRASIYGLGNGRG